MNAETEFSSEGETVPEDQEVFELGAVSLETKGGWWGVVAEGGSWIYP